MRFIIFPITPQPKHRQNDTGTRASNQILRDKHRREQNRSKLPAPQTKQTSTNTAT